MEKTKAILQGLCSYFHSDAGDLRARCTGCFDCRDRPRCSSISKTFPTNVASNKREIDVTRLSLDPRCKLFVTFFASVTLMISLTWTKELIVISFLFILFLLSGFWRKGLLFFGLFLLLSLVEGFCRAKQFNSNHPAGFLFRRVSPIVTDDHGSRICDEWDENQ